MAERDVSPPNLPFQVNPKLITAVVVVILLAGTAMSSVFMVDQTEEAVVLRLGQYARTVGPGLHFKLPFTIERNYNVPTQVIQTQSFGFRTEMPGITTRYAEQSFPQESIMLTGDLNIVDVEWIIQYRITDPRAWLFNVESQPGGLGIRARPAVDPRDPDNRVKTIRDVSQSVINLLAGDRAIIDVLGNERSNIEFQGQERMNEVLSAFDMGVLVTQVRLQNIVPPVGRVQDAFEDVNRAVQDRSRL
ncbi:MAG: FtsH protease activity modulator HflK, partial [Spirochaetaceae bacterium]